MLRALASSAEAEGPSPLTFQHWTGVSPYTSRYRLAGTCVFDKQSPGIFCCGHVFTWRALLRTYGRYFAEFLNEKSPVRLGLLDLPTCVGLRYGRTSINLRSFSWKPAHVNAPQKRVLRSA